MKNFLVRLPLFIFVLLLYNLIIWIKPQLVITELVTTPVSESSSGLLETTDSAPAAEPAETADTPPAPAVQADATPGADAAREDSADAGKAELAKTEDEIKETASKAESEDMVIVRQPKPVRRATLPSGAIWHLTVNDLILVFSVAILYVELLKSTRTNVSSIVEHVLSLFVFLAFFLEFLFVKNAGTSTFLIVTMLALIDVIGGFTITISTARRDFGFGAHGAGLE